MTTPMGHGTRAKYVLFARAARIIQNNADGLRQCHAQNGDWGADREAQQIHDEEVRTAKALRALIVGAPENGPSRIPEGDVLLHLARTVGLRNAMRGIDEARAKDILWMFLAKTLAMMDEADVVDAELPPSAVNYVDDLAVAEHVHSDNGARRE